MACKQDQITGMVLLTVGRPKEMKNTKLNLPKVKCSLESVVPLHPNLNCRPKALLKFEPLPFMKRLGDRKCDTQKQHAYEKRALDARKRKQLKPLPHRTNSCNDEALPALDGRLHQKVQTEVYLEKLQDYREEKHSHCQTDLFLDRPPTPYFIPRKIGLDKETQIYDGDLFDFDTEVQAVLEVLVGKMVEQSLLEVQEEEELASLRQQQRLFEELRNAEFEEEQRLEEQERRMKEEKMERLKQEISRQRQAKLLEKKICAVAYSREYIGSLVSATFGELISGNYFYDDKEKVIETIFKSDILNIMSTNIKNDILSRKLLDLMIRDVCQKRFDAYNIINEADFEGEPEVNVFRKSVRAESFNSIDLQPYLNSYPKTNEEVTEIVDQIKNIFFLKDMPQSHLVAIANGLSERIVKANENIYRHGEVGDEFYLVKSGDFEVRALDGSSTLPAHACFGEMAMMHVVSRKNSVTATSDGLLLFMKRSNFKKIISKTDLMSKRKHTALLRKVKFFRFMTDFEFERAADALKTMSYKDGEMIFKQGDKADSLIIIDNGRAKLNTTSEAHPDGITSYMEKESYFGELALISDIVRSSTAYALGAVNVLVLSVDAFERMVGSAKEISARKKHA